jgi:hypothetical protein
MEGVWFMEFGSLCTHQTKEISTTVFGAIRATISPSCDNLNDQNSKAEHV